MPGQSWAVAAAAFVAMWLVMMIAMMLPSLAPVLLRHRRPVRVALAYFAVWTLAGAALYPLGVAAAALAMRSAGVARAVPAAIGAALVVAGLVQLTRWKARELARCRDRSCCARGRRPGPRQAWRDGLRLGRHCVTCCAPAMLVLAVAGVMDVAAMAVVGLAITAERLGPAWLARVAGGAAIAAGVVVGVLGYA